VVYEAVRTEDARVVALKILHEAARCGESLARECALLRSMCHRGIVRVVDQGTSTRGRPFMAMNLVRGAPLRQHLREGAVDRVFANRVAIQLALAVSHAHARGVMHGDLKPENVMVTVGDNARVRVTLIDFGLAESVPHRHAVPRATAPGTLHYTAPERLTGSGLVGLAADVFSLGIVLTELLTGQRPHDGSTRSEVAREIVHGRPRIARAGPVSGELANTLQRCLAKRPSARPTSTELVRALWDGWRCRPFAKRRANVDEEARISNYVTRLVDLAKNAEPRTHLRPETPPEPAALTQTATGAARAI
jgi:serine/threonine-protein kinase